MRVLNLFGNVFLHLISLLKLLILKVKSISYISWSVLFAQPWNTFLFVFSFLHPGKTLGTISVHPSIFFWAFALIWSFLSLF